MAATSIHFTAAQLLDMAKAEHEDDLYFYRLAERHIAENYPDGMTIHFGVTFSPPTIH